MPTGNKVRSAMVIAQHFATATYDANVLVDLMASGATIVASANVNEWHEDTLTARSANLRTHV